MHGEKYTITFKNVVDTAYTLKIYEKDYVGEVATVIGAADFVRQKWQDDNPFAPVKGSVLEFKLINTSDLPISTFFSVDDDKYLVKLFHGSDTKFIGYLVQDDCSEILVDYEHEIILSATDNLGLLKDIDLYQASVTFGDESNLTVTIEQLSTHMIRVTGILGVGERHWLRITSGTALDGLYSVATFQYTGGNTQVTFDAALNGTVVGALPGTTLGVILPVDLSIRRYFSELLALCLKSTGLLLDTNVYLTIKANGTPNNRLFDNVKITPESFSSGNKWESCYAVLEKILGRFNASLLQADGVWNIVRWHELRPSINEIPGVKYDSDFVYDSTVILDTVATFGREEETKPYFGIESSILRPWQKAIETFEYKNPANLIKNINLDEYGEILSATTTMTERTVNYRLSGWEQGYYWTSGGGGYLPSAGDRILRIISDLNGNIKDRYAVISGALSNTTTAQSNGVEVTAGDRLKISFELRTEMSQPGPFSMFIHAVLLTTVNPAPYSANNRYLDALGKWKPIAFTGPGSYLWEIRVPTGSDTNQWTTASIELSDEIPFTGLFILKLGQHVATGAPLRETHYRNFRFEIVRYNAGSNKASGHQHTYQQLAKLKNKSEEQVYIDNTPSNSLAGTTFLNTFTGPVLDRTAEWNYNLVDYPNIGKATTREDKFWRKSPRIKMDGSHFGLINDGKHISALSVIRHTLFPDHNFIQGSCEIDYVQNTVNSTIWEMYKDTDLESDLPEIYEYKYLFE